MVIAHWSSKSTGSSGDWIICSYPDAGSPVPNWMSAIALSVHNNFEHTDCEYTAITSTSVGSGEKRGDVLVFCAILIKDLTDGNDTDIRLTRFGEG